MPTSREFLANRNREGHRRLLEGYCSTCSENEALRNEAFPLVKHKIKSQSKSVVLELGSTVQSNHSFMRMRPCLHYTVFVRSAAIFIPDWSDVHTTP